MLNETVAGVFTQHSPTNHALPLVLDSPHSGTQYPSDFNHHSDSLLLRRAEDTYVEELYQSAVSQRATLLQAEFPRSYIDTNRSLEDLDPALMSQTWPGPINISQKTELGIGLIWRKNRLNQDIYDRKLSNQEVEQRIAKYWQPYHHRLSQTLDAFHKSFKQVWHINCHSMPMCSTETSPEGPNMVRPEFCLGNRHGTTCDPQLVVVTQQALTEMGYQVAVNDPYAGVELVRAYSDPAQHRHSLQVEIRRDLYMDEVTLEKSANFNKLQQDLQQLVSVWAEFVAQKIE